MWPWLQPHCPSAGQRRGAASGHSVWTISERQTHFTNNVFGKLCFYIFFHHFKDPLNHAAVQTSSQQAFKGIVEFLSRVKVLGIHTIKDSPCWPETNWWTFLCHISYCPFSTKSLKFYTRFTSLVLVTIQDKNADFLHSVWYMKLRTSV